eukprot:6597320-Heterocapsa_arctica.AAC.1
MSKGRGVRETRPATGAPEPREALHASPAPRPPRTVMETTSLTRRPTTNPPDLRIRRPSS